MLFFEAVRLAAWNRIQTDPRGLGRNVVGTPANLRGPTSRPFPPFGSRIAPPSPNPAPTIRSAPAIAPIVHPLQPQTDIPTGARQRVPCRRAAAPAGLSRVRRKPQPDRSAAPAPIKSVPRVGILPGATKSAGREPAARGDTKPETAHPPNSPTTCNPAMRAWRMRWWHPPGMRW